MGESAALRRATGYQSSGARVERRQRRTRRRHTSSKWLWITKVKLRMYVPSWRTCLRWLEVLSWTGGRPQKGEGLWATQYTGVWYPLRKRPGAKQRPKATKEWTRGTVEPANGSPGNGRRRPGRMPRRGGWLKKRTPHCNGEDMGECLRHSLKPTAGWPLT
jgi:hypothetical protein